MMKNILERIVHDIGTVIDYEVYGAGLGALGGILCYDRSSNNIGNHLPFMAQQPIPGLSKAHHALNCVGGGAMLGVTVGGLVGVGKVIYNEIYGLVYDGYNAGEESTSLESPNGELITTAQVFIFEQYSEYCDKLWNLWGRFRGLRSYSLC